MELRCKKWDHQLMLITLLKSNQFSIFCVATYSGCDGTYYMGLFTIYSFFPTVKEL